LLNLQLAKVLPVCLDYVILHELVHSEEISVTTFRKGDKADPGYREIFQKLGFAEAELLVEFGYPTQRFVLRKVESEET
jgi:hypothetical protein